MSVAVTGARGRLGRAVTAALAKRGIDVVSWSRPEFDLDEPHAYATLVRRDRPDVVIHAAAWTDVDGCAREPDVAERRNALATAELARACARTGVSLLLVSTNEVFDGEAARAYQPDDATRAVNAYGRSKLHAEELASEAFADARDGATLGIARTAWLFGPPGNDFPEKILRAAERAGRDGTALRLVDDEVGSPSYTPDVAEGLAQLVAAGRTLGRHHVVNEGAVSRAEWALSVLEDAGTPIPTERVSASAWQRASTPPLHAPLEPTALPERRLRSWRDATRAYVETLVPRSATPA